MIRDLLDPHHEREEATLCGLRISFHKRFLHLSSRSGSCCRPQTRFVTNIRLGFVDRLRHQIKSLTVSSEVALYIASYI